VYVVSASLCLSALSAVALDARTTTRTVTLPPADAGLVAPGVADLLDAVRADDHERIAALLATSVPIDGSEGAGITALMVAAARDDPRSAELLLDAGASIDAMNLYGEDAIDLAARSGSTRVIDLLVERRVVFDSGAPSTRYPTSLMLAVSNGHLTTVAALVDGGARPDRLDSLGRSVLHHAIDSADPAPMVELLVSLGAPLPTGAVDAMSTDELITLIEASDPAPPS
jgi:ankyrin repeat protein